MKKLSVAIIGHSFMGKAHSNAWKQAPCFFDLDAQPVLKVACGRNEEQLEEFATRWGWERWETDWREVVESEDVDIVDVSAPTYLHHEIVLAAASAGKHIFCEKPIALDAVQAREMYEAAEKAGVTHFLNHNYRRCPAVRLAKRLIDQGRIGRIYHWRGAYLQDWIVDPEFPLTWHLRKETAGAGPHADLNSHSVDLARYLVGEVKAITGMTSNFITERPLPDEAKAATFKGVVGSGGTGRVTVEDAAFMVVEFQNGALGSFETTRFAPGRKNYNYFEVYGESGSILFDFQRMNELEYYSTEDPDYAQGFRTILATESTHEYIDHWWPPGHIIGYEHEFVHGVADFIQAVVKHEPVSPDLYDGMKTAEILDAGLRSAASGKKEWWGRQYGQTFSETTPFTDILPIRH